VDVSSWNFNPPVRALDSLVELIGQSFAQSGGDITSVAGCCLTCSAASVSKGTSEPRSWRFLRTSYCGRPSSLPRPGRAAALHSHRRGAGTAERKRRRTRGAGPVAPPSRSCSAGARARRTNQGLQLQAFCHWLPPRCHRVRLHATAEGHCHVERFWFSLRRLDRRRTLGRCGPPEPTLAPASAETVQNATSA
jgi:hypothetical protein